MRFRVLGPIEVIGADGPINLGGPKQRAVLAYLLVRANDFVPSETLIDQIWGDLPPDAARSTLHSYLSHLRTKPAMVSTTTSGRGRTPSPAIG